MRLVVRPSRGQRHHRRLPLEELLAPGPGARPAGRRPFPAEGRAAERGHPGHAQGRGRCSGARSEVKGSNVTMDGGKLVCPEDVIDAENSGTTIRIMAGIASLLPCATVLTGDESRPQAADAAPDRRPERARACSATPPAGTAWPLWWSGGRT